MTQFDLILCVEIIGDMGPDGFPGPKGIMGNTGLYGPRGDVGFPGAAVEGPEGFKGYPGKSTPTLGCNEDQNERI